MLCTACRIYAPCVLDSRLYIIISLEIFSAVICSGMIADREGNRLLLTL